MMARVFAWSLLLVVCWGAYRTVSAWNNPWSVPVPVPAVLSVMPDQPQGCAAKGCL